MTQTVRRGAAPTKRRRGIAFPAPLGRHPVSFTHPDKIYFPSGFTKGEMIRYYLAVAPQLLPHLRDRPVTLIRFPDGVKGESFYEKNAPAHAPAWLTTFPVPRRHHEGTINYIVIDRPEALAWCANLGAIELHPFLHRTRDLEQPTHVAFDLDPGEGSTILTCIEVAFLLRELFSGLGLQAFPKTSGSKGLQLYVPLNTATTYVATTPFARTVAELLAKQHPDLVVSNMTKSVRQKRVLIDWSQNSASKTTVAAYSLRGKRDEPFVSTPVTWDELERAARKKDAQALAFGPEAVLQRIAKRGDLFEPVLKLKQKLPPEFRRLADPAPPAPALARYAAKRDFTKTAEPAPATRRPAAAGKKLRFVIQKHAATRLHYDFRLEMNGTLKSWAVPKGLPYETGVKRAAFEVEDHPLDYINFEGTIPAGQYGGGTVMVWDRGEYELLGGDFSKGDLKLRLHGKKLKGEWHLFRIREEDGKPVWLVMKSGAGMRPLTARQEDQSVLTRRSMAGIARAHDAEWSSNRVQTPAAKRAASTARRSPTKRR